MNDGSSLPFLEDGSVDVVWSFVRAYGDMITAFARKIAPSAWAIAPLFAG